MDKRFSSDSIVALAAAVRERANEFIAGSLARRGVNDLLPAHGAVLAALFRRSPLQMSELAALIGRKKNTVTSLIATLEERGYCRREADPGDARAQLVFLTGKGKAVQGVQQEISREMLDLAWSGVDEADRSACVRALRRVLDNLGGKGADVQRP